MTNRVFGEIPAYPVGSFFLSRRELAQAGVHKPLQAGISGSAKEGADSIVLSGGYEDDQDLGSIIIYTGHGGRNPDTGQQVSDQLLTGGNLALAQSCLHGLPIRIIRGSGQRSAHSPPYGYRYDGLYRVEDYWRDRGKSGHTIWRFRFVQLDEQLAYARKINETSEVYVPAHRQESSVIRIVRDSQQSRKIKELYNYCCQVCGVRLEGSAGPYAEAAHIQPVGTPHHGPDSLSNLLCLCPNHHVLLDYGGITIADDFSLLGNTASLQGATGHLLLRPEHQINLVYIRYHRAHYYKMI